MSKYDGLAAYLKGQFAAEVPMSFAQIEKATGTKLPPKAQHHRAWWSNNPSNNVMTKIWLSAGYETAQVDIPGRKLIFKRTGKKESGMADTAKEFRHAESDEKKPRRHPAFGALKGTFTIDPDYDYTRPVYTPEEWTEVEKEMDADWDQIEEGLRKSK